MWESGTGLACGSSSSARRISPLRCPPHPPAAAGVRRGLRQAPVTVCVDRPTPEGYTCAEQLSWGKVGCWSMHAGKAGAGPNPCCAPRGVGASSPSPLPPHAVRCTPFTPSFLAPPSPHMMEQCKDAWMVAGGFCRRTCGNCDLPLATPAAEGALPGPQAEPAGVAPNAANAAGPQGGEGGKDSWAGEDLVASAPDLAPGAEVREGLRDGEMERVHTACTKPCMGEVELLLCGSQHGRTPLRPLPCPPAPQLPASGAFCAQPAQQGPCRGALPSWFWNGAAGACQPFLYGGCQASF